MSGGGTGVKPLASLNSESFTSMQQAPPPLLHVSGSIKSHYLLPIYVGSVHSTLSEANASSDKLDSFLNFCSKFGLNSSLS